MLSISFFSLFSNNNLRKDLNYLILFFCIFLLTFIAGFRGNIDGDYNSYLEMYNTINKHSNEYIVEPGYAIINTIFYKLGLSFHGLVFFIAILCIPPKLIFIYKYSDNYLLSILIYFSTFYFLFDFTQIRQGCAVTFFILSLRYIINKSFIKYLICILIASSFHVASLVLLPMYFFLNIKYNQLILYCLLFFCTIITLLQYRFPILNFFLNLENINQVYLNKANYYNSSETFSYLSIKQILLSFALVFIRDKLVDIKFSIKNILINIYLFGIIITTIFNQASEISYRLKWFFLWSECLVVIFIVNFLIIKYGIKRKFLYFILIIYYNISLLILLNNLSNNGEFIFPYKLFFQ
jgi:hypothetical protein